MELKVLISSYLAQRNEIPASCLLKHKCQSPCGKFAADQQIGTYGNGCVSEAFLDQQVSLRYEPQVAGLHEPRHQGGQA